MEPSLLGTLTPETVLALKVGLRVVHFVGLALGLGAATLLDLVVLRFMVFRTITTEHSGLVVFASGIVAVGLALLWLSGLGFLLYYQAFDPDRLANPKLWAKVAIVAGLTLNGVFIHWVILPLVQRSVGQRLLDGVHGGYRSLLLTSGSMSVASWYVPLLLGSVPQLNFAVPAQTILLAYAAVIAATATFAHIFVNMVLPLHQAETGPQRDKLRADRQPRPAP